MISNGSPVAAETDNAAFMSRTQDTSTVGKVNLNNSSSGSITDVQSTMNVQRTDINQNAADIDALEAALAVNVANLTAHGNLHTNTHGISSGEFVGTSMTQTITNKSFGDNVLPSQNNYSDIGSTSLKFKNAYLAGNATIDGGLTVEGNLTINGTTTTINTATLDVEDANITINKNGNDATSEGSGLTVDRTGTKGSLIYDSAVTSKFKVGSLGSEDEIVGRTMSQTLTNKTISGSSNTISNLVHGTQVDNPSSGVHGVTGSVVGTSDSQTLTNKTIAAGSNTISGLTHGTQVDNPSSGVHGVTGSVVGTSDVQTLTNKTVGDSVTLTNVSTPSNPASGYMKVYSKGDSKIYKLDPTGVETEIGGGTSGDVATHAALTANTHGVTGNIVGSSDSQTLTNKTIVAGNNSISGLLHGTHVDNPSSGVHGITGSVVGTSDSQTLTNKTISYANNTISDLPVSDWAASTYYSVGRIVRVVVYGCSHLVTCVLNHTSSSNYFNDSPMYWEMTYHQNNLLINGGFDIWQRGQTFSPTTTGKFFCADRWSSFAYSSSVVTITKEPAILSKSKAAIKIERTASGNTFNWLAMELESRDTYFIRDEVVTFSFYAKRSSNLTGTVVAGINYGTGSENSWTSMTGDTSLAATVLSLDISYNRYCVIAKIPSGATQIYVFIKHEPGTFVSAEYFQVEQAMLNVGPAPGKFSLFGGSRLSDLYAAKRFYEKSNPIDINPGTPDSPSASFLWSGKQGDAGGVLGSDVRFTVEKRVTPSAGGVYVWDSAGNGGTTFKISTRNYGGAQTNNIAPSSVTYSTTALSLYHSISSTYAGIEFSWAVSAEF